tara:strand:- start:109 stop:753 length:645 start_codon:yes stop_codon:yes gene_type:complete
MKTVIDAVKYYGGYNYVCGKHEKHHTHIANAVGTGRFYSVYASDIGGDTIICTISEYNQRIYDYKTNLGRMPLGSLELWQGRAKQNKSVFTQEMHGNGELPSVGMECLVKKLHQDDSMWLKCFIVGSNKDGDYLVYDHSIRGLEQCHKANGTSEFKPLTPPIELIDGKAYQFDYKGRSSLHGIHCESEGTFITRTDVFKSSICTNIQPLTVEVK